MLLPLRHKDTKKLLKIKENKYITAKGAKKNATQATQRRLFPSRPLRQPLRTLR
jgi:hypothetical protein